MRTYGSPQAFQQALEQRLRHHYAADGADLQRVRQLVVFQRFLARVVQQFGDRVIVKGGVALELRLTRARTTKDVDLRVSGDPQGLLAELRAAGRRDLRDWMQFEVVADATHPDLEADGMRYQGKRFRVQAKLGGANYGGRFGVDAAMPEPAHGATEYREGEDYLGFAGVVPPRVPIYPLPAHLAEKLHAYTLPRERPNSRVRDLPDIALLASERTIEAAALRAALEATFAHRNTHAVPAAVPAPSADWEAPYARMAELDDLEWRDIATLRAAVEAFLNPLLAGDPVTSWDPATWAWTGATTS